MSEQMKTIKTGKNLEPKSTITEMKKFTGWASQCIKDDRAKKQTSKKYPNLRTEIFLNEKLTRQRKDSP